MVKLMVADNHPIVTKGLELLFTNSRDIKFVEAVADGEAIFDALKQYTTDILLWSPIPAIVDFDEANGGEWRKSFHGYPHGYAQLVEVSTSICCEKKSHTTQYNIKYNTIPKVT